MNVQNDKDLPEFSGELADWQDFVDDFRVAVADQDRFMDSEKLLKLRACVGTKARAMIAKFALHDEDAYQKAWKRLNDHYLDDINMTLMDKESRDQWIANQLKADELPLLEDVTKFILMRIKTWDDPKGEQRLVNVPWNRGESAPKYEPGNNRKRTYDQRDKRSNDGNGRSGRKRMMECYRCKGDHTIVFCQVFRKDSACGYEIGSLQDLLWKTFCKNMYGTLL